jgi:hypothetical protein
MFDLMEFHMQRQLETVADALGDWREFEPEIVNESQCEFAE